MKNTDVYFCSYEPYENIPSHMWPLGTISIQDASQLMDTLDSEILASDSCIVALDAKLSGYKRIQRGHETLANWAPARLELSGLWYSERPQLKCLSPKAHPKYENALKRCAENLATGKCKDEYKCRILGTSLFPHLYGTQQNNLTQR